MTEATKSGNSDKQVDRNKTIRRKNRRKAIPAVTVAWITVIGAIATALLTLVGNIFKEAPSFLPVIEYFQH